MKRLIFVTMILMASLAFSQEEKTLVDIGVGAINSESAAVTFVTTEEHSYLYASSILFSASDGEKIEILEQPHYKTKYDEAFGTDVSYMEGTNRYVIGYAEERLPFKLTIGYQLCVGQVCYLPQSVTFDVSGGSTIVKNKDEENVVSNVSANINDNFDELSRSSGYMNSTKFLAFLKMDKKQGFDKILESSKNQWWFFIVAIIGGFLLNLTPCVLPLIPINLAIIGAGAKAESKSKGFLLGGVYGLGMAVVYGVVGGIVVLTGSQFGTLNASPVFNVVIAIIFVLLALGMFDVISIDFSRFQNSTSGIAKKSGYLPILIMGGITALLAGACVAPVVIAVILISSNMYASGNYAGLFFPLLLGVGMALPWPLAGGGMASLPKPGKWMMKVKYVFGILIFAMAIYYFYVAFEIWNPKKANDNAETLWYHSIDEGFDIAAKENKPMLLYFTADWCKNCAQMKMSTFKDSEVIAELDKFVKVKFDATVDNDENRAVLNQYGVIGLPEYIIFDAQK
ncbi:MAG: thioredoxin family protein [Kiritimatiellae bacterium]|jgi:thiol:disulfide interchange protein DsbD|nr:thioredoxin family protein [Kiritimatiellia bacterium]